jgi:hypothetical protein
MRSQNIIALLLLGGLALAFTSSNPVLLVSRGPEPFGRPTKAFAFALPAAPAGPAGPVGPGAPADPAGPAGPAGS